MRNAPAPVADAFCAGRLQGTIGTFGTLPSGVDAGALVDRALEVGTPRPSALGRI